jgi:hypothetical protein
MKSNRHSLGGWLTVVLGTFCFACGLAYESMYHLWRGSLAYALIPQDDFYYYYLTAKNLAFHGFSSFDGIVPTNGYHPLWLWCLTGLVAITGGNDHSFFQLFAAVQILSATGSALLLWRFFVQVYEKQTWLAPVVLVASLLLTVLIFSGMETAVVVPCYVLFLLTFLSVLENTVLSIPFLLSGLTASLMILARLDTTLALSIAFALLIFKRVGWLKLRMFLLGLTPVVAYLIYNHKVFGSWEPVSAEAKQLAIGVHFSWRPIDAIGSPRGSIYFLLTVAGMVLEIRSYRRPHKNSGVRIVIFGFPLLFALVLALKLSWSSYYWYFYPYPISAAAALFEIRSLISDKFRNIVDRLAPIALIAVVTIASFILYRDIIGLTSKLNLVESQTRAQPNIYIHALGIKPFTDAHPGRYAMGDRAGLTAFVTGQPILQLEGLAADQAMVDSIAAQADLLRVFRKYGVQYYIVSYPLREFHEQNWHWDIFEPHKQQVQPWAPVMHGRFYAPEVFRFPAPVGQILTSADSASLWVTRILDISHASEDVPGDR